MFAQGVQARSDPYGGAVEVLRVAPLDVEARQRLLERGLDALATPLPLQGRTPTPAAGEPAAVRLDTDGRGEDLAFLGGGNSQALAVQPNQQATTPEADVAALICSYSWPCETALRIVYGPTAACPTGESNGDPAAISWNGTSYGLFQIWRGHAWRWANWSEWADPEVNTAWAYELYLESGFGIWDCYR